MKEDVQQILNQIDIFNYYKQHVKDLTLSGNTAIGYCPFHNDEEGGQKSFVVSIKNDAQAPSGLWKCFSGSCGTSLSKGGEGGDILHFHALLKGVSSHQEFNDRFHEIITSFAEENNVSINSNRPIDIELCNKWHSYLLSNNKYIDSIIEKKNWNIDVIKKRLIGYNSEENRYTIPVWSYSKKVLNVRRYSPSSKKYKILNTKGYGKNALYGADLIPDNPNEPVIICEGESDCILLISHGFVACTATGGVKSWNKEWNKYFKDRDVTVITDSDEAGYKGGDKIVKSLLEYGETKSIKRIGLSCWGLNPRDSDISDWFEKYDQSLINHKFIGLDTPAFSTPRQELVFLVSNHPEVNKEEILAPETVPQITEKTIQGTPSPQSPHKEIRVSIETIRQNEKGDLSYRKIGNLVSSYFEENGKIFYTEECIPFIYYNRKSYSVNRTNIEFRALLNSLFIINVTTNEGRYVVEHLSCYILTNGLKVDCGGWSHTDLSNHITWINLNNEKGEIIKLSPNKIDILQNGDNEDSVFLYHPQIKLKPISYIDDIDPQEELKWVYDNIIKCWRCGEIDSFLMLSWMISSVLIDYTTNRAILCLSGPAGSGKSVAIRSVGVILYGEEVEKVTDLSSARTDASINPISILDNIEDVDINTSKQWQQFFLTQSTGIVYEKRKLYTDQTPIKEKSKSLIAISSIEGFSRNELITRTYTINFDKLSNYKDDYVEQTFLLNIKNRRDRIVSAIFKLLSQEIIPMMKEGMRGAFVKEINSRYPNHSKTRTNDFLAILIMISLVLEKKIFGTFMNNWQNWIENEDRIERVDTANTCNELALMDALVDSFRFTSVDSRSDLTKAEVFQNKYSLGISIYEGKYDDKYNIYTITGMVSELYRACSTVSKNVGIKLNCSNAKSFQKRLKSISSILNEGGWSVKKSTDIDGEQLKTKGCYIYDYKKKILKSTDVFTKKIPPETTWI